jgi:hypothetical protein
MTIPFERTQAIIRARELLTSLTRKSETPRVPKAIREEAKAILRHFPTLADVEIAHRHAPEWYGPVPPFQRVGFTQIVQDVIAVTEEQERGN